MRLLWHLLFLTGFMSALPCADAVVMRPLPIDELTSSSDLILHGTVATKECVRDPGGRIVTRIGLRIEEVWKGNVQTNLVTIVHGGGTVGDVRMEVSGQVEYELGEEVVAFLVINQRGEGVTLGLAQGKFHVWKDLATGEKFAHNLFHGQPEAGAPAQEFGHPGQRERRLGLQELAAQVKGAAR